MSDKWIILIAVFVIAVIVGIIIWRKRRKNRKMEHIVYIHIFEYRNLKNVGFSFDPMYDISIDEVKKIIGIKPVSGIPETFWGENIYSLTAIIGKNGTGKSTALRFALEALVEGSGGRRGLKGIVVTVDDDERFSIYVPEEQQKEYRCDGNGLKVDSIDKMEDLPSMETFYYGAHFNPLASPEDILTQRWMGLVNASDGYLMTRDLQDYGNELATNGLFPYRDYATAFNSQNQYRICYFLNQYESEIKKDLKLPRYIWIVPNKAGEWAVTHRMRIDKKKELPPYNIPNEWEIRDKLLAEFIYHDMVNMLADGLENPDEWLPLIEDWTQSSVKNHGSSIIEEYGEFIKSIKNVKLQQLCNYIYQCVSLFGNFCKIKENVLGSWLYFDLDTDKEEVEALLEWVAKSRVYLTSRFFDMYYAHDLKSLTTLSSGEQELLNLYSRIYDSIVRKHQRGFSDKVPQLFIFDEAEIGMHPEWQRKFVNHITTFLNDICNKTNQICQIVITSHSPIILSDIPVQCCNMLTIGKNGETLNIAKSRKQTFGANIFELYRDSFFLDGGMVGEFAAKYIQQLDSVIDNVAQEHIERLKSNVMLIGDRVVRDYLMAKLCVQDKDGLKEYYRTMLENLENEQD